ncbi:MAG: nuclear transport factor 2 family protein [Actinomycetota bacterium]|uniref:Nuclear transport factor 2 family protein n=1 Tax=Mycobacterium lentiflavum TaxID=141349 RepID=A0ABY3V035_MYCLN|nr:nuclear transport factor 2 family protein [Mycobacterium lentiflavum]MEE3065551.1 nuclear transport factor 2 family protein [Actinomycetota bacterium]ULP42585.1 nuclear transport factor 2 family protein [Mycobacterium lentiflavum]
MTTSDVIAITQLVNLYGLAVDSQRWELFDRIFADDVDVDYGPTSRWTGRERFKSEFATFHDPFDSTQHTMSSHVIQVDQDRAHSFCNGAWRLVRKAVDGNPLWDGSGWYDDALVRTPVGWRITHRVCRITWWTGNPFVNETIPGSRFDLATTVLRREADAGRVGILGALLK